MNNLQVPDKDSSRYERHSRDVVPNESQVESKPNNASFDVKKSSDGKIDEVLDDNKSSNPTDRPRPRSHFQVLISLFINLLKRTSLSDVTFLELKF